MGIIRIPYEMMLQLAKLNHCDVFVETGTFHGTTSKWASKYFNEVHTIEISDYLYNQNKNKFDIIENVTAWLGDSRKILPRILENLDNKNIFYWLDGHYSGGDTGGKDYPCPLMEELEIIFKRNNSDIILIDDARCFYADKGYPRMKDIVKSLPSVDGGGA